MRKPIATLKSAAYGRFVIEVVAMRARAGITQRELARRAGLAPSQVAKHETGERRIDVVELGVLCRACGESLVDFVSRLSNDPDPTKKV